MNCKLLLFSVFSVLISACSTTRNMNENHSLISSVNSDEFGRFSGICKKDSDTIKLFNNLEEFSNCPVFKLNCGKKVVLKKSNIKIDPNQSIRYRDDKIILYEFRKIKNKSEFSFFDFRTNSKLVLTLNKRNKIIDIFEAIF